jgi:hypothetical protein
VPELRAQGQSEIVRVSAGERKHQVTAASRLQPKMCNMKSSVQLSGSAYKNDV